MKYTKIHFKAFEKYLGPAVIEGIKRSISLRKEARGKLQKLPFEQFNDLTNDVYEELLRRTNHDDTQLLNSPTFPSKRNQARQKLGTLSDKRFHDLVGDLFIELLIRYPDLDPAFRMSVQSTQSLPHQNESPLSPVRASTYDHRSTDGGLSKALSKPSKYTPYQPALDRLSNRYEAELNVALRMSNDSNTPPHSALSNGQSHQKVYPSKGSFNTTDYELLKEEYHNLRKEHERARITMNSLDQQFKAVQRENEELKQSLSMYEVKAPGNLSLAAQFASLQRQHAEVKYEYEVELKELKAKCNQLESAQTRSRSMFNTITKSNEMLEFKLGQVNQALEKSQKESLTMLKHGSVEPVSELSTTFLISDQLLKSLRFTSGQLIESITSNRQEDLLETMKPLVTTSQKLLAVVDNFMHEISQSQEVKPTVYLQLTNCKEDYQSALTNLLTLAKQTSNSSSNQIATRFEYEIKELLVAGEDLQLMLTTNFCLLPYFSKNEEVNWYNNDNHSNKQEGSSSSSTFSAQDRHSSYSNQLCSLSRRPSLHPNSPGDGDVSQIDSTILAPLQTYITGQSKDIIDQIDSVLNFIKSDDFSTHLTDQLTNTHTHLLQLVHNTQQFSNKGPLSALNPILDQINVEIDNFSQIKLELDPIVQAKNLTIDEIEALEPTLKLLKANLAHLLFRLASLTKLLLNQVSQL